MSEKVKVIQMCAKTVDSCALKFLNEKGTVVGERDNYVPDYFPNEHYGDYVEFDIDIETGRILNWVKPTQTELKASFD